MGKFIIDVTDKLFLKKDYRIKYSESRVWGLVCSMVLVLLGVNLLFNIIGYSGKDKFWNFTLFLLGLYIVYCLWYGLARFISGNVRFARGIEYNLKKFIDSNNLLEYKKEIYLDGNGNEKVREYLAYHPKVTFSFNDEFLVVVFRLDGHRFVKSYDKFDSQLCGLFALDLACMEVKKGFVYYTFRRKETMQELVTNVFNDSVKSVFRNSIYIAEGFVWNYIKKPHALVTGLTGAGKTFFLAYLILAFKKMKAVVKVLDPKKADLSFLEKILGKKFVASSGNQIARILRETCEEMDKRYEEFKKLPGYAFGKDFSDYAYKPIFVIFDEFIAFMAATKDKKVIDEVDGYIKSIILQGRQAGVFIILTAQRADAKYIPGEVRDMLGMRIAFGACTQTAYKMVIGEDFGEIKLSVDGAGAGIGIFLGNEPQEFYSPYMDIDFIPELEKLVIEEQRLHKKEDLEVENIDLDKKEEII